MPSNEFAIENESTEATVSTNQIFAEGKFKNVYKAEYTSGKRKGEECVCKKFKSGSVFEDSYFDNELKVVDKALEIVTKFNKCQVVDQKVFVNIPTVWVFVKEPHEKALIEPMIENFVKFNSNTGWIQKSANNWSKALQALSHYSFHTTNRQLLLCDLQGGIYDNGVVLTDPVIQSTVAGQYGPTDLGSQGISTFFARHQCNMFCNSNWLKPRDKQVYFKATQGTTMISRRDIVNAIGTRGTFNGHVPDNRHDSGYASANQLADLVEDLEIE